MVDYKITSAVMGERPEVQLPNKGFLETLKPDGFMELIHNFYEEILDSEIAFYFPTEEDELALIKKRNGAYFMMMCGGDDRYISKHNGDFDQVKTHKPFSIPDKARTEWLGCWKLVLQKIEHKVNHDDIQSYWNWLEVFSKHIVNYENDRNTREDVAKVN
jgi:hemoglobin